MACQWAYLFYKSRMAPNGPRWLQCIRFSREPPGSPVHQSGTNRMHVCFLHTEWPAGCPGPPEWFRSDSWRARDISGTFESHDNAVESVSKASADRQRTSPGLCKLDTLSEYRGSCASPCITSELSLGHSFCTGLFILPKATLAKFANL